MALTQSMLKAMGIDDEDKRRQILDEHTSVLTEIREERDRYKEESNRYKEEAAKVEELQNSLKEAMEADESGKWKAKYEEEHNAFSEYRDGVEAEKARAEVAKAYREQVLNVAGVDPKRMNSIMRLMDLSDVKVEEGKVVDADKLIDGVRNEWSDFIVNTQTKGANVPDPPSDGGGTPSGANPIAVKIAKERHERLYGKSSEE